MLAFYDTLMLAFYESIVSNIGSCIVDIVCNWSGGSFLVSKVY